METNLPQVVQLSDQRRSELMLAYARRRAAQAELLISRTSVTLLIEKFDKDGTLLKAINESGALSQQAHDAELRLNALLVEIQKEAGHSLNDYVLDPDTGAITKAPEAAAIDKKVIARADHLLKPKKPKK